MAGVHPGMAGFLGSKAASVPPLQGGFPYLVNPYRSVLNGALAIQCLSRNEDGSRNCDLVPILQQLTYPFFKREIPSGALVIARFKRPIIPLASLFPGMSFKKFN